ncbi:15121_t:CDS:1, partial [Dentiscutata heterogama]
LTSQQLYTLDDNIWKLPKNPNDTSTLEFSQQLYTLDNIWNLPEESDNDLLVNNIKVLKYEISTRIHHNF